MIDKFWVFLGVFIDVSFTRVVIEIICTLLRPVAHIISFSL